MAALRRAGLGPGHDYALVVVKSHFWLFFYHSYRDSPNRQLVAKCLRHRRLGTSAHFSWKCSLFCLTWPLTSGNRPDTADNRQMETLRDGRFCANPGAKPFDIIQIEPACLHLILAQIRSVRMVP